MNQNLFKKTSQGFTLIETLVSILIFSAAFITFSTIVSRGVSSVNRSGDTLVAEYLAQEGIEAVRNIRDTDLLFPGGTGDMSSLVPPNCQSGTSPCVIVISSSGQPAVEESQVFNVSISNNHYIQTNPTHSLPPDAVSTPFSRRIYINLVTQGEYLVTSQIVWNTGTGTRTFELKETLKNWYGPGTQF